MSKRLANFGGVGGQPSPNAPGGSPQFGGSSGYAGVGVDQFGSGDIPMDDLMGRSRKPKILGFEKSMESMLEAFHDSAETDAEPYLLTFDERMKLKLKKKIRIKEQYLSDLAKAKEQKEDQTKAEIDSIVEKLRTVEDLLENFRKNTHIDFNKLASYYRRPGSLPLLDEYLPTVEENEDEGNPLSITGNKLTQPFTGIVPQYVPGEGVDSYIQDLNNPTFPDMHTGTELLMNTGTPPENTTHSGYGTLNQEPSPITQESLNNNIPLEKKLEKLKDAPKGIGRLDPDMLYGLDWDEIIKGKYPQRGVVNETPYTNDGMGGLATNDYPQTSNNPYFGVLN